MPYVPPEIRLRARDRGLYRPDHEHDSCGVGFIAHLRGEPSHTVIQKALQILENLEHRGAEGSDPQTGDGAGLLIQVPHGLFRAEAQRLGFTLPRRPGVYGVGMVFLPSDDDLREQVEALIEEIVHEEQQDLLGWRPVPVDLTACGPNARATMPVIKQFFVGPGTLTADPNALGRKLFVIRKRIENEAQRRGLEEDEYPYLCSLSRRTIVYKGLLTPEQLPSYYADLADARTETALALVHQRFSTNTFPSWSRAHPYRRIAHNGEINTLRGNVNWMKAREPVLEAPIFGEDIEKILPVVDPRGSDSAMFDDVLELLVHTGRSLPNAIMMMIPEAWQKHASMPPERRAFYEYHSCLMEPWDGPACITFTDGKQIGAVLDRNGLRPARYTVTKDDFVIMASEAGVLDVPPDNVRAKNRLQPGRMFLVDTDAGVIVDDAIIKEEEATRRPWQRWLDESIVTMGEVPPAPRGSVPPPLDPSGLRRQQMTHGYTKEDLRILMAPMAKDGKEAIGSMGNDTPLAVLSDRPQLLFNYFKQLFAQVTNPPIDPIREELVMTLRTTLGPESNLFEESPLHCRKLQLHGPILENEELEQIRALDRPGLRAHTLTALFDPHAGPKGLGIALERLCRDAERAVQQGGTLLILSDRGHGRDRAPIPSLLSVSAVHHHLIRAGLRKNCGLIVESGEAREIMHFCLLIGYGAGGVNPYLAYESISALVREKIVEEVSVEEAHRHYVKAVEKGILKVMSKMGISTLQSYRGAQIFEALGLSQSFVDRHFTGTPTHLDGVGLDVIAAEAIARHEEAWRKVRLDVVEEQLDPGGSYQFRRRGEHHMWNPTTLATLQHAVRSGDFEKFRKFSKKANESADKSTIRGLLELAPGREPIALEEVEPASEIVRRFKTGAMSFGSISAEAHESLAIAMNRIGARSNSGEGGEDDARFVPDENGDWRRSAIKQVASGRFGVTIQYLNAAEEIQIKIAQGAKPGEGGQLPGHKVDEKIAKVRHSTPGVGLISPPPHHDIYSIEDLSQLIFDLKNANPDARITVKLVSEVGVGTIAAGVAKAKADVILISCGSGGTGASPLTSIKHAGSPWEIGLAETQQTLVLNDLRGRVKLETDGQLKTGRDVVMAALLGAEEYGFGSISLITMGCIMMRVCHLNTCPVGVATQDPRLRARFAGQPEHVINFMTFVAQEVREIMASLGVRTMDELIGRVDWLKPRQDIDHPKAKHLDLSKLLHQPAVEHPIRAIKEQDHELELAMDTVLIEQARPALERGEPVEIRMPIRNVHRTACTMLSSRIARLDAPLPDGLVRIHFTGSAGQSFGAFLADGLDVTLEGDANDYFGKGMSGGRLVVYPPEGSDFPPEENIIIGNVSLYGATKGEVFIRGMAGERFGVRNSGAHAVVEGVGDHGCEYMTGGRVIVLGTTGRNFAAGMSGGIAYVLDVDASFASRVNKEMVELESLTSEDLAFVRSLVHRHYERTMSALAWRVLSGWKKESRRFVKVMPTEYKRVLTERGDLRRSTSHAGRTA